MGQLEGRVALITGASRGIGRGSAICLAEEGADVVVTYRTHPDEAAEVKQEIEALGQRALVWQVDVAERDQVKATVDATVEHFGRLDILVANAAYSVRNPLLELDWEDAKRTFDVTMFGVYHACQFAAQQMVHQGQGGKIIIISSVHAEIPVPESIPYNMSKAAINHLTATLAAELVSHRINVNVINPGWIDTPGERAFYTEEQIREGAKRMPWGRLGTIRDIGRAVVYLASDDADYVTGTMLRVDGGFKVCMQL